MKLAEFFLFVSTLSFLCAATVPNRFTDTQWVSGLSAPTAMAFAPDGRLFVCEQAGAVRVIKNGQLLPTPFVTLTVSSLGERGLLGITFDPNFATNQYVYVYYTATSPVIHNRISRFTANGDVALPGSEAVILDLDNLSGATNHNGGAMHFGLDGKLYVAVGENATPSNAQTTTNLLGKMLRINPDPSNLIPADNPFVGQASGNNQAIWALGLRNPFTFAVQPVTGRIFINDVGQNSWEEINQGVAGGNYGWPATEGDHNDSSYLRPIFTYANGIGPTVGRAITGGTFYNPTSANFPTEYTGRYFFADFISNWVRQLDPSNNNTVTDFASGYSAPVDLRVGPDGALYVLARNAGAVHKVSFTQNQRPFDVIWQDPVSGSAQVWFLGGAQGTTVVGAANLTAATTWRIVGVGDFNRDGGPDVLWQDPVSGMSQVWFLGGAQGTTIIGTASLSGANSWRIQSITDFNGDGRPDCVWQDPVTGHAQIWFLGGTQGTTILGAVQLAASNSWRIVGTGDFNADSRPDLLWQDPVSGAAQVWYLGGAQGNVVISAVTLTAGNAWRIAAVGDFSGDGRPDVVWQDPVSGASLVWFLGGTQGTVITESVPLSGANPWRIVGSR